MTLDWKLAAVAARLGQLVGDGDSSISGVTTDSRFVSKGDLFVAVVGETHDGHDFVEGAVAAGATAPVVEVGRTGFEPRIEVDSTADALLDLAAMRRDELTLPVVAVTGSTGKTTTKDMLAAAIPGSWASPASYNNEVGVPLTVLQTPNNASTLVVEMGSRGRGHLNWLMPAVRPSVAVITNLGVVHLETFGDTETLADAKWEIVEGLASDGVAVLPADEPRLRRPHPGTTVTFGVETDGDVIARDVIIDSAGLASFVLETPAGERQVSLSMPGIHQPANAAAATAAALAVGVDLELITNGLNAASGSRWRMEIHRGRFTVVNDAYNANPTSVEAALRTVAGLGGRRIAVLGMMAELGGIAASEHKRMGRLAASLGYAAVLMVGEDPGLVKAAGGIGRGVTSPDQALEILSGFIREGDTIVVKASRSVGLEVLAEQLIDMADSVPGGTT
ncbi:MAG: UDP-N-acetylmuramoyl-tripeptide--D-alanyl-D-alanine ligase [bacterium]|nr:UDP-N-acetylmuramoyl-tripeptide--D-alanyl-D-alanine ligase [bacterium]